MAGGEQVPDVRQTLDLELLRLFLDHLPVEHARGGGRVTYDQTSSLHRSNCDGRELLNNYPSRSNGLLSHRP